MSSRRSNSGLTMQVSCLTDKPTMRAVQGTHLRSSVGTEVLYVLMHRKRQAHAVVYSTYKRAVKGLGVPHHGVAGCLAWPQTFWFLVCFSATQLATTVDQRRIQMVRSNKVARKRLAESNGTPAMDIGCEEIRKRRYTQTKNRTKHTTTIVIQVLLLICQCVQ